MESENEDDHGDDDRPPPATRSKLAEQGLEVQGACACRLMMRVNWMRRVVWVMVRVMVVPQGPVRERLLMQRPRDLHQVCHGMRRVLRRDLMAQGKG